VNGDTPSRKNGLPPPYPTKVTSNSISTLIFQKTVQPAKKPTEVEKEPVNSTFSQPYNFLGGRTPRKTPESCPQKK
jgi:hypothetical protein